MNTEEKNVTQTIENEDELFQFVEYSPEAAEMIGYSDYSYWKSVFQNFLKKKSAVILSFIFVALVIFSFVALAIGKYQYDELIPDTSKAFISPNSEYWFGTDNIGRDYWSQVWYASQTSIKLAVIVAIGECIVGITIGCIWGYVRQLDRLITEIYNIIHNIPTIIYMTLIALLIGQSFTIMATALICFGWLVMARNVRNLVLMYRDREYNLASRSLGTSIGRILVKNILPYLISVIILRLALSIPGTISMESMLSYLGLGLDINTPSLGILLRNARTFFLDYPYLLIFPAIIVSVITVTFYLMVTHSLTLLTHEITYKEQEGRIHMAKTPILSAKDVEIQFSLRGRKLTAIRKCSLDLYEGETLAIVGESGSGKSVFTKSFVGMLDANGSITGGSIAYNGQDISKFKTEKEWLDIRGKKIAMVMQDPMTSLNPLKKIGKQIQESIELHQGLKGEEAKKEALEMLKKVGIPDPERRYNQYPHEFSGGMRQRVVIAIAVACRPQILICDEPTTALDVTIQAQILDLIRNLQSELHMTVIYITHDLGVVANVADRVAVMYAGQIIEFGLVNEIFYDAWHPYTWALLSALPQLGVKGEELPSIEGTPPNLFNTIQGDAFAPRNKQALAIDFVKEPPFFSISETHQAKTWYLDPRAPKIEQPEAIRRLREKMRARG